MTRLFLDTGVLVAVVQRNDARHDAARDVLLDVARGRYEIVACSDYVLAETFNFIARRVRRLQAADMVREIVFGSADGPPSVTSVLRVHGGVFAAALARYTREFQRGLSFTDWTSVALMEEHRIDTIATFDGGFAGLVPNVVPPA